MPLSIQQTIAPTAEPLDLEAAKAHLRVEPEDGGEDDYINALITAAREYCELYTERQIITATWQRSLDCFPTCPIRLPRPRLQAVTAIAYVDGDGVTQTLAADQYQVDAVSEPGRIVPAYGVIWPIARVQMNAVTITYRAGYGDTGAAVPKALLQAMKMLISQWFENREPVVVGTIATAIPLTVNALLGPHRVGTMY